jgi:hypothetical protein
MKAKKKIKPFTLSLIAMDCITELINKGWQFMLTYEQRTTGIGPRGYEADFTRKLKNGLWDNHELGHSLNDPGEAVCCAYRNIKEGKRLKRR